MASLSFLDIQVDSVLYSLLVGAKVFLCGASNVCLVNKIKDNEVLLERKKIIIHDAHALASNWKIIPVKCHDIFHKANSQSAS